MPKIYGFKLFGVRGSKYALKHDYQGKPINEDEIREILSKEVPMLRLDQEFLLANQLQIHQLIKCLDN